jgi:hypothetical protein
MAHNREIAGRHDGSAEPARTRSSSLSAKGSNLARDLADAQAHETEPVVLVMAELSVVGLLDT